MTDISIIIPLYNGVKWINNCMKSIASQTIISTDIKLEIVVYNDGSIDDSAKLLTKWQEHFSKCGVDLIITGSPISKGVGAAKNGAVKKSCGSFLCFQDIDDIMHQDRIMLQWNYANYHRNTLVGSRVCRTPINSTPRFVRWANSLTPAQLKLQIYMSNGPTLLMPTWFCHKSVYDRVGGFNESGLGTPEDLIFFYNHVDLGGDLHRIDEELVIYTYHELSATFSVKRELIWQIQLERLQIHVFPKWSNFIVWNAGKSGRKLVRALSPENLEKVTAFCDVDVKKIGRTIELYCQKKRIIIKKIPVIHFRDAKPPLVICVKLDLTKGQFESNLKSLNLKEGEDYILFS
ncbi:UDP-GlcNAc:betaGal beta-1,3-N-acetylglucosaminyltransferase-like protein 1 [Ostrinia furnacalis]|uniref:UDP-GlcNAc:betaGal beta-1,3-N-acetylglucosaminyltransferase-like protein 1 n=1 Tax=Ostrinia furnacalis TaxID=93504 RepID=UPI00103E005E|nr:UDP-GlcNAc:betaGal beta-1,3-N-acetylglucosaminyltransferase-like protein 1 [Ostrinia furnacalis]